ncbi:DUF4407 domain-containing protein [Nostoc sp. CHAB 5784]|uniref:DUF4407 domain-containing protein n=1 Tax=Nostoc mirabile TaxID=2907820 RepID=UPI001E4CE49F|nr:DUF4407 domain-containing protein [Nostoc mirabile]MCC5668351.1 DUF4407 domain-containing protein [Nostoc mirabile CHAB5784]
MNITRNLSKIRNFFLFCSGGNVNILLRDEFIRERSKYEAIGANVFLTGILASLSGGYLLFTVFPSNILASGLGLLWGLTIFNLNRFFVLNIRGSRSIYSQLPNIIFRIILAAMIGIIIAKSLELKLFETEIKTHIENSMSGSYEQKEIYSNSLILKLSTLEKLSKENLLISKIRFSITLLFILIEINPILIVILSSRGAYDELIYQLERRALSSVESISNKSNDNTDLEESSLSAIDKVEIERLLTDNYQQIRQEIELQYRLELEAKERELDIRKKYSDELQQISEKLAKQPISINIVKQNLEK